MGIRRGKRKRGGFEVGLGWWTGVKARAVGGWIEDEG